MKCELPTVADVKARQPNGTFRDGNKKVSGRVKGTPNKITVAAKDAIALAAEGLGGTARLVEWAREDPINERAFWSSIYPKLLPLQVTGSDGGPVITRIERHIIEK